MKKKFVNNGNDSLYVIDKNGYNYLEIKAKERLDITTTEQMERNEIFKGINDHREKDYVDIGNGSSFSKVWDSCRDEIIKNLNDSERSMMFMLFFLVSYKDNLIRSGGSNKGHVLNQTEIAISTGKSAGSCNRAITGLINKEILKKITISDYSNKIVTGYVFNPYICCKGSSINVESLKAFDNSKWHKLFLKNNY